MVRTLIVAATLVGGCKAAAKPDCDGAGAAVAKASEEMAAHAKDDLGRETARRIGPAAAASVVLRCKQDGWSAAATDCVKQAKGGSFKQCEKTLTRQQNDNLRMHMPPMEGLAAAAKGCGEVMRAMTKFWDDRAATAQSDQEREAAKTMGPVAATRIGTHCAEDGWSADAIDCMKAAPNGDFAGCESKLTKEQVDKLKASAPPMQAPPPAP